MINPYFDLHDSKNIDSIDELLKLNIKQHYYKPGDTKYFQNNYSVHNISYETAGLFRGQISNCPLIPKCFRKVDLSEDFSNWSDVKKHYEYIHSTSTFREFCKRAEIQNPDFPKADVDRMTIAQHYGIATPLLDWSQNIFTAIFFAIREIFINSQFKNDFSIYIYHIIDERLLNHDITVNSLSKLHKSSFIKPSFIDKRIERQRGLFTFHPHPALNPEKIPCKIYILKEHTVLDLRELMDGLGFTEDYFFPDYSGIANAVINGTSL